MTSLFVEISNGVIAVVTGLTLYGVARMFKWIHSVDQRLDDIERRLSGNKENKDGGGKAAEGGG